MSTGQFVSDGIDIAAVDFEVVRQCFIVQMRKHVTNDGKLSTMSGFVVYGKTNDER